MLEPRFVQRDNFFRREQIAVRDHARNHSVMPNAPNDCLDFRVQQRLSATDRHDRRFQIREPVDSPDHLIRRYGRRKIVVLIAISTRQVAAPNGNDMSEQNVPSGRQSSNDHLEFAPPQLELVGPLHL